MGIQNAPWKKQFHNRLFLKTTKLRFIVINSLLEGSRDIPDVLSKTIEGMKAENAMVKECLDMQGMMFQLIISRLLLYLFFLLAKLMKIFLFISYTLFNFYLCLFD